MSLFSKETRESGSKPGRFSLAATKHPGLVAVYLFVSYFLVELFGALLLKPDTLLGLAFGAGWSLLLTALVMALPKVAGRIVYGITYYIFALWTVAQTGYEQLFGKLMWLSTMNYADEGAGFADVLLNFSPVWWAGLAVLVAVGVVGILLIPKWKKNLTAWTASTMGVLVAVVSLCLLPQAIYAMDNNVWGTHSEYGQSSSARASYQVMYDSRKVYNLCGMYQLTVRDLWKHQVYPLTPAYKTALKTDVHTIDAYLEEKGHNDNKMTGALAGKNVILVLMESMDDWLITEEETPTICRMMEEGIRFTEFYTPGYGSVRTFNTEFCANTGIYLPTTGTYVFDYVTNHYNQSLAGRLTAEGYSALTFHYNNREFYSRGVFEPAMGYDEYVTFEDYTQDKDDLMSETYFLDNPELRQRFFRQGPTLNFIITRSAHLSYTYNEVLNAYAFRQYPQYKRLYDHQEEDCARVKARLVDDLFARLLQELEAEGQLENTVIVGITDHYTYGFKDTEKLLELSGVEHELLLEKTPCFIWSPGGPDVDVTKTANTADLLPTLINLLGLEGAGDYLGSDVFDPNYRGYAIFPDGSWATEGIVCTTDEQGEPLVLQNKRGESISERVFEEMAATAREFIHISNILLTTDYYTAGGVRR